jgi:hypothetical protein
MSAAEWDRTLSNVLPNAKTAYTMSNDGGVTLSKKWSGSPTPDTVWNALDNYAEQHYLVKQCWNGTVQGTIQGIFWGLVFGILAIIIAEHGRPPRERLSRYIFLGPPVIFGGLLGFLAGRSTQHCKYRLDPDHAPPSHA